ncbi:hypothetical protein JXA40_02310 [bacterium]|nr:hypothetical protein [candidate division CSSED10-310 bacterium]
MYLKYTADVNMVLTMKADGHETDPCDMERMDGPDGDRMNGPGNPPGEVLMSPFLPGGTTLGIKQDDGRIEFAGLAVLTTDN